MTDETTEYKIDEDIIEEILLGTDRKTSVPARTKFVKKEERILRKTIVSLVKSGHATFLFLKDDETREYWSSLVNSASKTVRKRKEAWAKYETKLSVYNKLTEQERKALGLRKPVEPRI